MTSQFYKDEVLAIEKLDSLAAVNAKLAELRAAVAEHPYSLTLATSGHTGQVLEGDEYHHWLELNELIDGPLQEKYYYYHAAENDLRE